MKYIKLGLLASFLIMLITWGCKTQVIGRSAKEYAIECEKIFGPLPSFSCDDAVDIPATKNGVKLTHNSFKHNDCDRPFAFGEPCQSGNKVGRYTGINNDGTENKDVVFITFCRDGGLGVIGYKFSTGQTCFLSINDDTDASNPSNLSHNNYNIDWMSPEVVANDGCQNCHMASPFLHTPAIDQVMDPNNPNELLVPITTNPNYYVIGKEFEQPHHNKALKNSCTSCHRPQCTKHFENYPLDELVMPPPFGSAHKIDNNTQSKKDREEIREWCKSLKLEKK